MTRMTKSRYVDVTLAHDPDKPWLVLYSDDLVQLATAERRLGLKRNRLKQMHTRRREGNVRVDLPHPVIETADGIALWSMAELAEWWPNRIDGRSATAFVRATLSPNND